MELDTSYGAANPRLWVRLKEGWTSDPDLRWFIAGNAHTHRGHFHVCSETGDEHATIGADAIADAAPEVPTWLAGFLQGQQASLSEFLGGDDRLELEADGADLDRWESWNRRFLASGHAPHLHRLPARDARLSDLGAPTPWCYVGDVYRVWSGGDWQVADPQPEPADEWGWVWPGSVCEADDGGVHDEFVADDLPVCIRCHRVDGDVVDTVPDPDVAIEE